MGNGDSEGEKKLSPLQSRAKELGVRRIFFEHWAGVSIHGDNESIGAQASDAQKREE
jgi:hypothetical protein